MPHTFRTVFTTLMRNQGMKQDVLRYLRGDAESEVLKRVSQKYIEGGVPVLVPTTYENEDGETVHADGEVIVEPGTTGFVRAFVDELPSPFDCDSAILTELPDYPIHTDE